MNIEDRDQVEIMKEVVAYFEFNKSGVSGSFADETRLGQDCRKYKFRYFN